MPSKLSFTCAVACLASTAAVADISLDDYRRFLADNSTRTAAQMQNRYGGDRFLASVGIDAAAAAFSDSVVDHFELTNFEESLLERHGFVVTERVHPRSFGQGFLDVYNADLPVFISTDAVRKHIAGVGQR